MMSVDDMSSYNNELVYEPSLSPKSQFTPSNIQMIMKAKKQTFEFTNATILFLSHVFLFPPFSSLISCSSIMTIIMMAVCLPMILQTSFIPFLTPFLHGLIIPSLLSITRIRMRIRMNTIFPSCRFSLHFLIKNSFYPSCPSNTISNGDGLITLSGYLSNWSLFMRFYPYECIYSIMLLGFSQTFDDVGLLTKYFESFFLVIS